MIPFGTRIYKTPILLKGYHSNHNPDRDYKAAKTPIPSSRGFTRADFKPPTQIEVENWMAAGGWIGHLVPEGMHVLDVEDPNKISLIRKLCKRKKIIPPINITNNGVQFIFAINDNLALTGADKRMTRMGFTVTDRAAQKNYIILPPINHRTFENEDRLDNPPIIPNELMPARNTVGDTLAMLGWGLGEAYRAGSVTGYNDMDNAFMAFLISCDLDEEQIFDVFELVFLNDFDEKRTVAMYQRTKERKETGEPTQGAGSLIRSLQDKDLNDLVTLVKKLERLSKIPEQSEGQKRKEAKIDRIIQLALTEFELFHDKELKAYATMQRDGHSETYPLRSKAFRTCLSGRFWAKYGEGIGGQIVQDAMGTLESYAIYGGVCCPVYVRLAEHNDMVYLDLGNEAFEVVEISSINWRILQNQNKVKFWRPASMAPLPRPTIGRSIKLLRKYINLANEDDWPALIGFILMCLNPRGPYPILCFTGEQGSAKSTGQKVIKALTDPSTAPLRSLPRETRDLAIASKNAFVLAYDNLSDIPPQISDALCRQATGSGFATRTLYSDDEETIINTKRPIMLNGIDNFVQRHDLADRSVVIGLAVIPDEKRIAETDFWADFSNNAPEILGALLDAVSCALENFNNVRLDHIPRMADFALWVTAAESQLGWLEGTFLNSYSSNRRRVIGMTLEADLVGTAVKEFMESRDFQMWKGKATDLLRELERVVDEKIQKGKTWPKSANSLSNKLKRAATSLRVEGIEVTIGVDSRNNRRYVLLEGDASKITTSEKVRKRSY